MSSLLDDEQSIFHSRMKSPEGTPEEICILVFQMIYLETSGELSELDLISFMTIRGAGLKPLFYHTLHYLVGVNWLRWPDRVRVDK